MKKITSKWTKLEEYQIQQNNSELKQIECDRILNKAKDRSPQAVRRSEQPLPV